MLLLGILCILVEVFVGYEVWNGVRMGVVAEGSKKKPFGKKFNQALASKASDCSWFLTKHLLLPRGQSCI